MAQDRSAQAPVEVRVEVQQDQAEPGAFDATDDALLSLLQSFAGGRAFLERYTKRIRHDDIAAALAALARIEARLTANATAAPQAEAEPQAEPFEIPPDEAYVPYEMESVESIFELEPPQAAPLPVTAPVNDLPPERERTSRPSADKLLAQVMALSPDERIALFS